jgi:23S rRNA (uridine2552-2'-O)-methyltransferase
VRGRRRRRDRPDHYARKARRQHYPARSVFKLEEIDRRVKLLRRGARVLDLGAAPGSWTLYAAERVGPDGLVAAVDRTRIEVALPDQVETLEADLLELDPRDLFDRLGARPFDAVISDMAPRTTGHRFVDQSRSYELFGRALDIAAVASRAGGSFVGKIFHGEDFEAARKRVRDAYDKARVIRPAGTRSESYEVYIVGLGRR